MKLIKEKSSILAVALFIEIGVLSACGSATEKVANDKATSGTETTKSVSADNKKTENKAAETAQTKTIEVFDGRNGEVKNNKLSEVDLALVEADVRKKAKEDFLTKQLGDLAKTVDWKEEFKIMDVAEGSFTKPNSAGQRAVLYRYSDTNGLVILSDGDIVAHYSGGPGDYAFYTAIKSLPDVNQNGLSEIILFRNVEDKGDIIPYLFEAKDGKIKFLGEANYFATDYLAMDSTESEEADQTAYVVTVQSSKNPVFLQDVYERKNSKAVWKLTKKAEKFSWENRTDYDLTKIG